MRRRLSRGCVVLAASAATFERVATWSLSVTQRNCAHQARFGRLGAPKQARDFGGPGSHSNGRRPLIAVDAEATARRGVQLLEIIQRNSRIADAQLIDTQKNLALLKAGSRAEDIAEAQARRAAAAAFLDEGKAELDQMRWCERQRRGRCFMVATVGEFMSVYAPTPIAQITIDATTK